MANSNFFPSAGKKNATPSAKQTKAKGDTAKAAKKGEEEEDAADGVSSLKISDAPPPKSKGLDVIKEFESSSSKRSVSFVVVGK